MADLDVTKKRDIYHTLYRLNLSFSAIVRRCDELQLTKLFNNKSLRTYQGLAQELLAEINEELLQTLYDIEMHDWYRFGKVRQAQEKELRDPDDVFIVAKQRREELRRQGKKVRA
jgi:predicted transcriptional regulator